MSRRTKMILAAAISVAAVAGGAHAAYAMLQADASAALRATGQVGEQADGFMACVATCDATTRAEIAEINAKRAAAYRDIAQRTGVSEAAAAQAAGQKVIQSLPPGQWYRPLSGGWTRK